MIQSQIEPEKPKKYAKYKRHVAIRFAYLGWNYNGLADQPNSHPGVKTVEGEIMKALYRTSMVDSTDLKNCQFSRCGRTDKGVSGMRQVMSLKLRSVLNEQDQMNEENDSKELDYLHILNQTLPEDIRLYEVALHLPKDFDARFSCQWRRYKYYFRVEKDELDIELMNQGAQKFIGVHDFRNFCKVDGSKQITNFQRKMIKSSIEPVKNQEGLYCFDLTGTAFLWHQVRSMMAILFLIGQRLESPDIVSTLLDIKAVPQRPVYEMASDIPLIFYDCAYSSDIVWKSFKTEQSTKRLNSHVYDLWYDYEMKYQVASTMSSIISESVHPPYSTAPVISRKKKGHGGSRVNLIIGNGVGKTFTKYTPLMEREKLEPPDVINAKWLKKHS